MHQKNQALLLNCQAGALEITPLCYVKKSCSNHRTIKNDELLVYWVFRMEDQTFLKKLI